MKTVFKKTLLALFCGFFFCACLFFSLGMLIPGASDAAEGADFPRLLEDGVISDGFGEAFETWFSRRFAYRSTVVDGFSALKERLFSTGNEQVIVGRDGFLFFTDTLDDYTGANPMTEAETADAAAALKALKAYADEHDAAFLFVCAPNKNTVYPEKIPRRYQRTDGATDLDRLYAVLENEGIPYIDLRPVLTAAKEEGLLYHRRDTHWNGLGARRAYSAVMDALSKPVPDTLSDTPVPVSDFVGDLDTLLYPGGGYADDDVVFDADGAFVYTSAYATPMDLQITTRSGAEGSLLLFRDSFANALIADFAQSFGTVRFERANPYRIDLLETEKNPADTVIVLIAERNLRDLIGSGERAG